MPSSPTDLLEAVAALYDQAFEAAQQGELERIGNLLEVAEQQLADSVVPAAPHNTALEQARDHARSSYGRLLHALEQSYQSTKAELAEIRRGRRVLSRYGQRRPQSNQRLERTV